MIMSYGGIPLLYYGDEIGTVNDCTYLEDESKAGDTRWVHRPRIDWNKAELRKQHGSPEQRIYDGLKHMIAVRKATPAFADYNNRELLDVDNPHLFAFLRNNPTTPTDVVLVVANCDDEPQYLDLNVLGNRGEYLYGQIKDLHTGEMPAMFKDQLVIPPYQFYWLSV
jgi:amylosucrase